MTEESHLKRFDNFNYPFGDLHQQTATTTSNKTIKVATKILLDDAKNGFKNGNFVCSPFSIEIVLGMLAFGAEGQTLKQLLEFLGHKSLEELRSRSSVSKILEQILSSTVKGGPDIRIDNRVCVAKQLRLQPCYQEVLETVYKTKPDNENKVKPAQVAETINSWTKEKTNGLIPEIIGEISPDDALVIVNSLYFKGIWRKPFPLEYTKEKDFHLINGQKVLVPFMTVMSSEPFMPVLSSVPFMPVMSSVPFKPSSNYEFDYGSFESYKILRLPYESGSKGFSMFNRPYESEFNGFNLFKQPNESRGQSNEFSLYIFLPDRIDGLQDLLQLFDSDNSLFYRDFNLPRCRMDELWIPKFEMSCTFSAHDVMQQMGLTLPFDKGNKELSGIVEQKHLKGKNLYASKILQRSVIKVDEKGTEAAAVTTVRVEAACGCLGLRPPPEARFVADHPFMFMIRENTSGTVFFSGVVVNPGIKS